MEALLTSLSILIGVIGNYFWFFLLVMACLVVKRYRIAGLCMLALTTAFGYHAWIVIGIMIILLASLVIEWAMDDVSKKNNDMQ